MLRSGFPRYPWTSVPSIVSESGLPRRRRRAGSLRNQRPGPRPKALAIYQAFLKESGFTEAEINIQVEVARQQGNRSEAERWNRYLTADHPTFNTQPNRFLVEMVSGRKPGPALDVAMWHGRNATWLAQQGWDVSGFDIADQTITEANETPPD